MAGRPKHAPEFKQRAVDPYRASGTTYAEVGRKLGVDPGSIADWVRRADSADAPPEAQSPFQMQEDLRRLRREADAGIDRLMDAIAGGLNTDLAKLKIEQLKLQVEVAESEIVVQENAAGFDAEDFADFLQFSATMDDSAMLSAFVYQIIVTGEEVTVTLNYDVKNRTLEIKNP